LAQHTPGVHDGAGSAMSRAQFAPTDIRTDANVAFEKIGAAVRHLPGLNSFTSANVPASTTRRFKICRDAKQNCPVSKALAGQSKSAVKATLKQTTRFAILNQMATADGTTTG